MAESRSVIARLRAEDDMTSVFKRASTAVGNLQRQIKSGFAFGVLQGVGQAAFHAVTNSVTGLISEIDSSNASWKTFTKNMQMLGKSDKEIASVKNELQEFAQQTIYSSSDMATTFAQLEAVGVKNTTSLVKGFGGLASAAENPQQAMKTLSQQATQMAAKPNVAWQDFKLMLEQTPAGIAAVAKEMGMTTSELVTNVQDGKIATDKFFDAIAKVGTNKAFSELATEAKTVGQAMDGLKETVGNKLTPAFEVLNKKGIGVINKLADKVSGIDADALANKVSNMVTKVGNYLTVLKESFSGVGSEVWSAIKEIGSALTGMTGEFGSTESLEGFKSVMTSVADAIKSVASFCKEHAGAIATLIKWLPAIVLGFKGLQIASTVAPGVSALAKGIAGLAGKAIGGIASKLFGISKSQEQVGTTSATSGAQMLNAAKSYALMGVAVLAIAAGFALLAFSAIALANAGGGAIAVMAGLVVALVGLGVGMAFLLKTLAPMGAQMMPVATAMLAMGAAVLLVSAGFTLLAGASIALANSGGLAIGIMVGMVAAIALLAVGAALLAPYLATGAAGLVAFGGALALCGVAAVLAATALVIVSTALPVLVEYGLSGALAIAALGASMYVFAAGAALAGAGALVLGAGLLVMATGLALCAAAALVLGVGILALGTGVMIASAALTMLATQLPVIAAHGVRGAVSIVALGASLVVFAAGATVAGTASILLGAGLLVVAAALLLASAGMITLAAGSVVLGVGLTIVTAAITAIAAILPTTAVGVMMLSASFTLLAATSVALSAGLMLANAAIILIGISALAASVGVLAFGAGMITGAAGSLIMAAALIGVNSQMKSIAKNAKSAQKSLSSMQKSIKTVEAGLNALGSKVKSAMNKLVSAFDDTANKAEASGRKVGEAFANGLQDGLAQSTVVATSATMQVSTTLSAGNASAFSSGRFISVGFANGMLSMLGVIRSAASKMAAAADKAIRAKAKIGSPSKVADQLGSWFGEGYENGLLGMVKNVWDAAEKLVSLPTVATPDLAMAYSGELSAEYDYYRNSDYTFEIPLTLDGKEVARATAKYTQDELDRQQSRNARKHGNI